MNEQASMQRSAAVETLTPSQLTKVGKELHEALSAAAVSRSDEQAERVE